MSLAIPNLDGGFGDLVLGLYTLGGIVLAATALLPGTKIWVRVLKAVIGLGLAVWSAWVWLFGGYIIINLYVAILPFLLAFQGIMAMVKSRREQAAPQPAAPGWAPTAAQGAPPAGH